jgi:branched-chain amino acid transport system permease protein
MSAGTGTGLRPNWRWALWGALAVVAVLLPQQLVEADVNKLSHVIYVAVAALGLALLTGFNGQISLGHGAFLGIGAYTTLILTVDYDVPYAAALVIAMAFCFVVGVAVGLPALRITGVYLALVTLALATLFPQVVIRLGEITGGGTGRTLEPRPGYGDAALLEEVGARQYFFTAGFRAPEWTGLADDQYRYYVFLALAVVAFVLIRNLTRSRVGRALVAIRDNEVAAEVAGVEVSRYKLLTFGVSAALAGMSGWMFAVLNNQASPTSFTIVLSITLLVVAVLGGAASIVGPALGALLVVFLQESVPEDSQRYTQVVFGVVLIVIMLVAPGGIVGIYRKVEGNVRRRRAAARAAAGPGPAPSDPQTPQQEATT